MTHERTRSRFCIQMEAEGAWWRGVAFALSQWDEPIPCKHFAALLKESDAKIEEAKKIDEDRAYKRGQERGYREAVRDERARYEEERVIENEEEEQEAPSG